MWDKQDMKSLEMKDQDFLTVSLYHSTLKREREGEVRINIEGNIRNTVTDRKEVGS